MRDAEELGKLLVGFILLGMTFYLWLNRSLPPGTCRLHYPIFERGCARCIEWQALKFRGPTQ